MNYPDLHKTIWKANVLARVAVMAMNDEASRVQVDKEAQAMLDYLWGMGFRPTGYRMS